MAYKVLGQSAPAATTATDLYTVPAAVVTLVSTLHVANRASTATTFRVAVRPAGAALANQHYIAYDATIAGNEAMAITTGICVGATDVVTVYTAAATVSFSLFGLENTA